MIKKTFTLLLAALVILAPIAAALPSGATLDIGTPTTKGFFSAGTTSAQGGNRTNLSFTTETQTLVWQGFFGELLGNITLEDANGSRLYSWPSNASISAGTILASTASTIQFANLTAINDCATSESITGTGSDRANLTFTASSNSVFTIGHVTINASTACTTNTYINNATQSSNFEEIVLKDSTTSPAIFATRIEPDTTGFDGATHDYQMIVPDPQNSTTTTYYFYVELK